MVHTALLHPPLVHKQAPTILETPPPPFPPPNQPPNQNNTHQFSEHARSNKPTTPAPTHTTQFSEHARGKGVALAGGKLSPDDFTVKVLTTGYWPSYSQLDVHLPAEMLSCIQVGCVRMFWRACLMGGLDGWVN